MRVVYASNPEIYQGQRAARQVQLSTLLWTSPDASARISRQQAAHQAAERATSHVVD